ncbi:MAG: hypothetical protein LRZ85_02125 [Alphaproteobacteria bacterium]|nr:hypothetical protein [Alphaproteobacteria bacterium]MCD8519841.1 hypothetical protein [Alphaproteobacteria bacterium]MCD8526481.1 hypothetical protein [Alphaproteobacteria bacterium]MCD8570378.1 hypothetical protein [Alphaproteobacteria bacterium]
MKQRSSESGNILLYILIAVALLAALSYAVSRSNSGSTNQLSAERSRLAASEILEYATILGNAASQLRLRGCKLTEISFEGAAGTYTNAATPGDNTCKMFHASGGGVNVQTPPQASLVNTTTPWVFSADMEVNDVGSTCADDGCTELAAYIPGVRDTVCDAINDMSSIDNPMERPTQNNASFTAFQGAYNYVDTIGDETSSTKLSGKGAGCFWSAGDNAFIVYKVLLSR